MDPSQHSGGRLFVKQIYAPSLKNVFSEVTSGTNLKEIETMVKHAKQDVIIGVDKKKYLLPKGIRSIDLANFDSQDADVLLDLYIQGRRSRTYYNRRGLLHIVRRLKSRGYIVGVRMGSHYSYDLSKMGYFAVQKGFV